MPNPTRREREESLIAQVRKLSCTMDYVEGNSSLNLYCDLDKMYAALEAAHRREDAIRLGIQAGFSATGLLAILDADDVPQGARMSKATEIILYDAEARS
jgi:hypothetical protein